MRLCYALHDDQAFIGLAHGEGWIDFTQVMQDNRSAFPWLRIHPAPTMVDLLQNAPDLLPALIRWSAQVEAARQVDKYRIEGPITLLAPVTRPSKIVALGRNYAAHAREVGNEVPDEPILFAKAPSSIVGPGADIVYPPGVLRLDPEIELGVVIGRTAKLVPEVQAMDYVAGYTIVNDVTARDMQRSDIEKKKPWFRSKSFDTFCPMGPYLTLTDEIADPHDLELTLRVNGQVRQSANTGLCLFKIPQLIAYISRHMTLEPGDVIATGTPEGIAPLEKGDVLECAVSGLGTLTNQVV